MLLSMVALLSVPIKAEPLRRASPLGGGFIELLMTGRSPQSNPLSAPVPSRDIPVSVSHEDNRVGVPATKILQPHIQSVTQPHGSQNFGSQNLGSQNTGSQNPLKQGTIHQAYRGDPSPARATLPASLPASLPATQPSNGIDDPSHDPASEAERQNSVPARAKTAKRFAKQEVAYDGGHAPGTIVIDTPNKFLYLVQAKGRAIRYGIGVGRPGFEWAGVKHITRKREWPDWRPPPEMLKRRPDLPRYMEGGIENPLGARALYLGSSLYRIHGTNEPQTIGRAVSSGCIRMKNADVEDLYERVSIGTKVIVI